MSKAEKASELFNNYNCAQSVIGAYAEDFKLNKDTALSIATGFGGGMGRLQETCGAVSGAIMALGLLSEFKEGDGRDKIDAVYANVRSFVEDFKKEKGTVKCRELLGCNLLTEEGHKFFVDNKLRENCRCYIKFACELLDKYIARSL